MKLGPIISKLNEHLIDVVGENLLRDNNDTIKLKRYREVATQDRDITGAVVDINWNIDVAIRELNNGSNWISMEVNINKVSGFIEYEDYPQDITDEAGDILDNIDVELKTLDDVEYYVHHFDSSEDGWEVTYDDWDDVRVSNLEPKEVELNFETKKITVHFK